MSNKRPLAYLGINETNPPEVIIAQRAPTTADTNYDLGDLWVNESANTSYQLLSKPAGSATWGIMTPGASDVDTINSLPPVLGDIVIAGGTNLTDTNAGNTVTLDLDDAITLATSVTTPILSGPLAGDLNINSVAGQDIIIKMGDAAGANKVSFVDSASIEQFAIDSNGGISTLIGATITGALTQTAGAVNIAQDNAADAVNIAGGNVARAITLGSTGAHTLAIGSAAAGAITVDTAAGFSIDGATASNVTVTGAGLDLTLSAVGGSVNLSGSQAAVDAVNIDASAGAGGIDIDAGTGGIAIDSTGAVSIQGGAASDFSVGGAGIDLTLASAAGRVIVNGEEAAADAVTILSAAGGLDTNVALQMNLDSSQAAATAVRIVASDAAGGIDIDSGTGGITVDSTGVLSLDSAGATNLTATGAFDVTVSSSAGSVIVNGGEAAADAVQITASNAGAGGVAITAGIGGVAVVATGAAAPVTVDAVGVLELNSSGAAIGVGNDANNFAVNVGTAGTRTVTVGSTAATSSTVIQSGTGDITVTGTVKEINAEFLNRSGIYSLCNMSPIVQSNATTGAAPTGATGDVNLLLFPEGFTFREFVKGAGQTIIAPRADATGLLVSGDLTATEGYEINADAARANAPLSFTIGTSAAFFAEMSFTVADVSGCEPMYFGFRKTQANNATYTNYTDFVGYGLNNAVAAGDCIIATNLNNAGVNTTDTNDAWADGALHTLKVLVSAAGVVTFTFDGGAPTVTQAYTFDNGDVVHFWYTHVFGAAAPDTIYWNSLKVGYQA